MFKWFWTTFSLGAPAVKSRQVLMWRDMNNRGYALNL